MNNPDYNYTPTDKSVETLEESHAGKDHELDLRMHVPHHDDEDIKLTVECERCGETLDEIWHFRYTEREDGERFGRNEPPECDCDESSNEGQLFTSIEYFNPTSRELIGTSVCKYCETEFTDLYDFDRVEIQ